MLFFSFKLGSVLIVRSISHAHWAVKPISFTEPLFGLGFINIDSNFRIR